MQEQDLGKDDDKDNDKDADLPASSHPGNLLAFLAWLDATPRTFADTMEAWRTSCPRLSAWEDATTAGLVGMASRPGVPRAQAIVALTAKGRAALRQTRQAAAPNAPDALDALDALDAPEAPDLPRHQNRTRKGAAMTWSAKQYVKFENERTRPVRDLLAAVPGREPRVAVDIGCGPGNSTEVLAACFPGASVTGLDSSADMVEAARKRLPGLRFEVSRIETWYDPGPYDVILANAVLQWLPDHGRLLPALAAKLAPGGSLAIQVPDTLDTPAHRLMREVAADGPWAGTTNCCARIAQRSMSGTPPTTTRWPVARRRLSSGSRAPACAPSWTRWMKPSARLTWCATPRKWRAPIRRWRTARCCCRSRGSSSWPRADGRGRGLFQALAVSALTSITYICRSPSWIESMQAWRPSRLQRGCRSQRFSFFRPGSV